MKKLDLIKVEEKTTENPNLKLEINYAWSVTEVIENLTEFAKVNMIFKDSDSQEEKDKRIEAYVAAALEQNLISKGLQHIYEFYGYHVLSTNHIGSYYFKPTHINSVDTANFAITHQNSNMQLSSFNIPDVIINLLDWIYIQKKPYTDRPNSTVKWEASTKQQKLFDALVKVGFIKAKKIKTQGYKTIDKKDISINIIEYKNPVIDFYGDVVHTSPAGEGSLEITVFKYNNLELDKLDINTYPRVFRIIFDTKLGRIESVNSLILTAELINQIMDQHYKHIKHVNDEIKKETTVDKFDKEILMVKKQLKWLQDQRKERIKLDKQEKHKEKVN